MKICFVIGTLKYSGAEKIVTNIISALSNIYDIEAILLACDQPFDEYSIKQYPLYINEKQNKNKIIRTIKRVFSLRKILKKEKYDLVVSFGCKYNLDVILSMFGVNKTKLILCERNDPVYDPNSIELRIRRRLLYRFADGFVFQTKEIKSFFSPKIQKKCVVIPNFVTNTPTQYYNPNNTEFSFVTCGRLDDYQKDQTTLIKVFAKFLESHPNYKLEFYGSGPDYQKYISLVKELKINDSVIFHGYVSDPINHMPHAKFFIFSSRFEGMPNALIEALSFGIPCISTDCSGGGARFLINNGINGLLIPFNNEESLLSAMKFFADNYEKALQMGNKGLEINQILCKDRIINLWEEYFNSFCR